MKHNINYYIEHIEPMLTKLNRQQEIKIDNTEFLVLKIRTKDTIRIIIASQYTWKGIHCWVYNTNTKQVENILHGTLHYISRFRERHLQFTKLSETKQLVTCIVNMFKYTYNIRTATSSTYITDKKISKLGIPNIKFITYIRTATKKK